MLNSLYNAKGAEEYSNQIKNIEGRLNRLKEGTRRTPQNDGIKIEKLCNIYGYC